MMRTPIPVRIWRSADGRSPLTDPGAPFSGICMECGSRSEFSQIDCKLCLDCALDETLSPPVRFESRVAPLVREVNRRGFAVEVDPHGSHYGLRCIAIRIEGSGWLLVPDPSHLWGVVVIRHGTWKIMLRPASYEVPAADMVDWVLPRAGLRPYELHDLFDAEPTAEVGPAHMALLIELMDDCRGIEAEGIPALRFLDGVALKSGVINGKQMELSYEPRASGIEMWVFQLFGELALDLGCSMEEFGIILQVLAAQSSEAETP